ncbi:RING finger domain-containing protein [Endozoicomonas acroporae]|uniref:RING finger domain-containing protein n=2 Tax=Endozoicomonas acroporae TaxID=1701104 RepID=UPI000C76C2D6|nr:RING finger domain-containing protein [Endozoicomonas acroporae]
MLPEPTKVSGCMNLLLIALSKKNNTNELTQMNEISMFPQTSAENPCLICFEDFSQEPDHALSTLKCGHVFGRSCIIEWRERNTRCPMCRENFFLPKESSDGSFTSALKDQFYNTLYNRTVLACTFVYCGFFYATNLEKLARFNACAVAVDLACTLAIRCVSEVSDDVMSVFFGRAGTQNCHYHNLPQKIVTEGIVSCSLITAGWLCRKLLLGY